MSGPLEVVLIIAAVGYVLFRRLAGEPAQLKRMLVLPAVLAVIGVSDLHVAGQTPTSIAFLIGTTVLSLLLGALRGVSVRVEARNGVVFIRYTVTTVVLWVANLAIKFGGSFLLGAVDPAAAHAASTGLLFTLGAGMVAEGLVVLAKTSRVDGRLTGGRPTTPPAVNHPQAPNQPPAAPYQPTVSWPTAPADSGRRSRRSSRRGGLSALLEDVVDARRR
jgi:hypothetical protein